MAEGESQHYWGRRAGPRTMLGAGGIVHDGNCRHREMRPMGNGVPYRRSIWVAEGTGEPGKGVERGEERSICVLEGAKRSCADSNAYTISADLRY